MHAGCLHNLSELARRRNNRPARGSAVSPRFAGDPNNAFASSLERKGSIERSLDLGAMTASTVLGLYLDGQQEGNELIMLSELQVGLCCGLRNLACVHVQQRMMMFVRAQGRTAAGVDCRTSMLRTCVVHGLRTIAVLCWYAASNITAANPLLSCLLFSSHACF
jgi:hypothetical protein